MLLCACPRTHLSVHALVCRHTPSTLNFLQVQSFWASLLVELCACLHQDVFNLRQQLAKTLALTISYLGGPASSQSLTGAAGQVPAGTGLQAAQALAAAKAGQAAAAAASAAAAGSALQAVQALRSGDTASGGSAAGVEALRGAARALAADFLAALASATTIVRLLKFSPNTGVAWGHACKG
ncbi:hypothetical protein DUNSADRAFT_13107 [Dunaliella salina]|uniref:Encoded protein n=1 Tax=Dunaliella salina TaxID=3046 RepID=A0ABQ7GA37_DUNSA|nr:hypothetical protein DUNSADRAFT_13107 [Dunaliella salina]|eukprot:KAF5831467.1 hypothetical protein DUNSADRAFT_13107 [Dunaliella salina]